ncbi:enoyl-CoA hydratase/isomerase family protein [Salinarimonas soli]|uniref:3-hydroxyisobutyryl-CoA hydrolase n=1 Tax=Salinarimonas soli TaxID=1638099 RepID=A0A5B2VHN4_9HYPH|nr:enoyl-CoA hydratase/isomerase family protein [Salinarimonas soli]KAA2238000.1 enoyl-CoA hydratase/isomerase family protein [Salinarimonas soli]
MSQDVEAICERSGAAGLIVLNRPAALNALTLGMVRAMREALDAWAADPAVTRIVVTGAGEKAFCAGGDIRRLYEAGRAGRREEALTFWREEYELNALIRRYPKPYVALVDGIVMGGGVGVSLHGSHRVAGERYLFAMPEVGIGFFPDVGATHALPRLPGRTGVYLALTGERVRAGDALALGLATHAAPSAAMPALREALIAGEPVDAVLARHAAAPEPGPVAGERAIIDRCFAADTVPAILARLDEAAAGGSDFAGKTAATIRAKSPTSLAIALEQMRLGAGLDFEEAMRTEFRVVSRIAEGVDFYEGVRAVIVDKDGAPRWRPDTLDGVSRADVEAYFAPLPGAELDLSAVGRS